MRKERAHDTLSEKQRATRLAKPSIHTQLRLTLCPLATFGSLA
jgi:hypothetical protein